MVEELEKQPGPVAGEPAGIPQKRPRQLVMERLLQVRPELNPEDEDALFGAIGEDYDRHDRLREKDRELGRIFTENPRFAAFFMDVFRGGDVLSKFIEHFGREALEATDDPEKMKAVLEADRSYRQRQEKGREILEEQQANLENSAPVIEQFRREKGLSEQEIDQLLNEICNDASAIFMGIYTPEVLEAKWKALHYDESVDQAALEGEVRGRNTKIGELKRRTTPPGGLPPTVTSRAARVIEVRENPTLAALKRLGK